MPKRLELSFRSVLQLPKASSTGDDSWIRRASSSPPPPAACVRKRRMIFVVSVLPAPLSPLMITDWLRPRTRSEPYAAAATSYTCGASAADVSDIALSS